MRWSSDLRNGLIRFRCLKQEDMQSKLRRDLDPLDLELVERALESTWTAVKGNYVLSRQLDSDEELEANLRRELIEIALANGVNDAEMLRDILLTTLVEP
jgi:hypothetical protein